MRLLVVSQYFWPENFRVNDLVRELVRRGHQVTVLTGLPNYPEGEVLPEFQRAPRKYAAYAGAEIVRVPMLPRGKSSFQLVLNYLSFVLSGSVLGATRLRARVFDAMIVFQPSPITSCLPALVLRRRKATPVLLWVLDLWPDSLAAVGAVRSRLLLQLIGRVVSFIYRRCDLILVPSRAFVRNVEQYAGGRSRIRYFPGWPEPMFTSSLEQVEPAAEVKHRLHTFNVLFAGNIGEAQDFPSILQAVEALRHDRRIHWLFVGDGRKAQWVREQLQRRELEQNVTMLGRHPIERMPGFFRAASALLVTLKPDAVFSMTIPGKLQTYLAAGLPVIGMLDGEGARIITEAGAGFVCPAGDGLQLAAAVQRLAALTPGQRSEIGARGRTYCERVFGRDRLLARLEAWIRELAFERPRRGHITERQRLRPVTHSLHRR